MIARPVPLYNPADSADTSAYAGFPAAPLSVKLLDSEGPCAEWRLVELFSGNEGVGGPFNAAIWWSGGGGSGQMMKLSTPRGTRVCVYARSVRIQVANLLTSAGQRISGRVAEAFMPTANQWEEPGVGQAGGAAFPVDIPPFALTWRYETVTAANLAATTLDVLDGGGTIISSFLGNAQVAPANPLGGARRINVSAPAAVRWRVVFHLAL